jgi:hypothetical protein
MSQPINQTINQTINQVTFMPPAGSNSKDNLQFPATIFTDYMVDSSAYSMPNQIMLVYIYVDFKILGGYTKDNGNTKNIPEIAKYYWTGHIILRYANQDVKYPYMDVKKLDSYGIKLWSEGDKGDIAPILKINITDEERTITITDHYQDSVIKTNSYFNANIKEYIIDNTKYKLPVYMKFTLL